MNQPRPLPFDETKPPFVTVLVVSYNGKKYLKACLDSAVDRNSCHELRAAARGVTKTISEALNKE